MKGDQIGRIRLPVIISNKEGGASILPGTAVKPSVGPRHLGRDADSFVAGCVPCISGDHLGKEQLASSTDFVFVSILDRIAWGF